MFGQVSIKAILKQTYEKQYQNIKYKRGNLMHNNHPRDPQKVALVDRWILYICIMKKKTY